jgi:predicted RNA-binding Zn ribbon-like protein
MAYAGSMPCMSDVTGQQIEPRLVGGHVALDLVNTVAPRIPGDPSRVEFVGTAGELRRWAERVELITAAEAVGVEDAWTASPASATQALHAAIDMREATYTALMASLGAGIATAEAAVAALEQLALRWAAATARSTLIPARPPGPAAVLSVGTAGALLIPDRLAYAAVDLVRTIDLVQLRVCPVDEGGCGWLFLDRSRNGSRRWCAMEDCGTQAKSRRLTQRRRVKRVTLGTDSPGGPRSI